MKPGAREPGPRRAPTTAGAEYLGVGVQFAAAILLFLWLGQWADRKLGTAPWLLLLGVFVGAAAGFYSLYRQLVVVPRERQRRERRERDER